VGGRNLDLAARLALAIRGRRGIAVLVGGTDGRDGSSRAAGALVDGGTAARAEAAGLGLESALEAFDTESALEASGDLHVTGPTGTNVNDLRILLIAGEGGEVG
jgi:hydroxypyruvate reductase